MPPNHYKRYARNDFYSVNSNKENSIPLMSRATTSCIRSIYAPYSRALVRTLLSITFQHKHNVICQIFGHNCFNYLSDKMRRYQLIPCFQTTHTWLSSRFEMIGRRKAAVFPEPVWAQAIRSRLANITELQKQCLGSLQFLSILSHTHL